MLDGHVIFKLYLSMCSYWRFNDDLRKQWSNASVHKCWLET